MKDDQDQNQALLDLLLSRRACDKADLARVSALQKQDGGRCDRLLLRLGLVEESALVEALSEVYGMPLLDPMVSVPDRDAVRRLSPNYLLSRLAVPLAADGPARLVAMSDPLDMSLRDELSFHLDAMIAPVVATSAQIRALLTKSDGPDPAPTDDPTQLGRDAANLKRAEFDGPVIRFVQDLLSDAVLAGASDIHAEASDESLSVRFRVNGKLVPQPVPKQLSAQSVIARLKVMAGLNVSERRLPQDGRLQTLVAGRRVDFRFSSLPTHLGESVVARVLDPKALRLGWDKLGFDGQTIDWIKAILDRPSGLFLVTGPTGSGKTTTLYTALAHLNSASRKIITVEDPVEYNLPGLQQIQVNDDIGLSFGRVLRGVLRHDPNVIMVGEIRDAETAEIAVRAAQVGRLVLSTLHTNTAQGAVNRLIDLGVPRFLLDDVLHGVIGQDLQPILCPSCRGKGCDSCQGVGVSGRKLMVERWTPEKGLDTKS